MPSRRRRLSDDHTVAVVDFVLDDLGRPAGESLEAGLEFLVLVLHLDGQPAFGLANPSQREAALLRLIGAGFLDDLRVEHDHVDTLIVKGDDTHGGTPFGMRIGLV